MAVKDDIRMLEGCMKAFLLEHLRRKKLLLKTDSIINEFPINRSARRVDIVIAGRETHAFEIKSEADSLYRLQGQVDAYLKYFDKVTVIAAAKHINHIMETTPPNVAVWKVQDKAINIVRRGKKMPVRDRKNLIQLMRITELSKTLRGQEFDVKSATRSELAKYAMKLPVTQLRHAAIDAVKERYAKTTSEFWHTVGRRRITPMHLIALSPTSKEREAMLAREEKQSECWEKWAKKAQSLPDDVYLHHLMKSTRPNLFGPVPSQIKKLVGSN